MSRFAARYKYIPQHAMPSADISTRAHCNVNVQLTYHTTAAVITAVTNTVITAVTTNAVTPPPQFESKGVYIDTSPSMNGATHDKCGQQCSPADAAAAASSEGAAASSDTPLTSNIAV